MKSGVVSSDKWLSLADMLAKKGVNMDFIIEDEDNELYIPL